MKNSKKNIAAQRQLLDKKLLQWQPIQRDRKPPSGWLKAVRTALGINTRQLADRLGVSQPSISFLEEREKNGKVTLDLMAKVAKAMGCRLTYAIIPDVPYSDLESIVEERAKQLATDTVTSVEHSMRLEAQGSQDTNKQIDRLAYELKSKMDSRLWESNSKEKLKGKKK